MISKGKLLILNCGILKTGSRKKFKFDENAFKVFSQHFGLRQKLDLNASINFYSY